MSVSLPITYGQLPMEVRLQKLLSQWGIASRRQAEQMILSGQVSLNGQLAHLGQKANPAIDCIQVKGQIIQPVHRPPLTYLLLHKPKGVVSTCTDPWQRLSVLDLLPTRYQNGQGIHPVGRLDADTTGALLLTNDGQLTFALTHPRHHIPKTYQVWVEGTPPESILQQWRQGVWLEGQRTLPAQVQRLQPDSKYTHCTKLEVILQEGKNRQIRRIAKQLGYPVRHLHRTKIGTVALQSPSGGALSPGHYRVLTLAEIQDLEHMIEMKTRVSLKTRSALYEPARP